MVGCAVAGVFLLLFCGASGAQQVSGDAFATLFPVSDVIFVAGTPGIDPKADALIPGGTRTEIDRLHQDEIIEAEDPFYAPRKPVSAGPETSGQQASSQTEEWEMAMFDRFLAATPKYRRTTPPERQRLFREFQEWRRTQH
jgi:hypothetical protein